MSAPTDCLEFILRPGSPAPSPCFIIDLDKLRANVRILDSIQRQTGAKILLALKAFSAYATFPLLSRAFEGPLWGVCASSVDEARLGRECFGGEVHAFAAAWSAAEIKELGEVADCVVFNSVRQFSEYAPYLEKLGQEKAKEIETGLRVNPECSTGKVAMYDPCAPGSRLGVRPCDLANFKGLESVSGLHFHALCEQGAEDLATTLTAFEHGFGEKLKGRKWLNWGGGHHITKPGYNIPLLISLLNGWRARYGCQIYLEPGEAVALDTGWLTATVLDIVDADLPVAILDASAACHMPDVLEMPYTPDVWRLHNGKPEKASQAGQKAASVRLAGKSCLAGDVIGEYSFDSTLVAGDRLAFGDMAIYSMVKTNTFNGLRLPAIGLYDGGKFRLWREFGYDDFKSRL